MCIFAPARGGSAFARSLLLSLSLSFTSLCYRATLPRRFEFQIPRGRRVGRRGNNRLSSVSTRLCAVICFRRPPGRWYTVQRDLRRGAVSARPQLLFMAPPGMYQN